VDNEGVGDTRDRNESTWEGRPIRHIHRSSGLKRWSWSERVARAFRRLPGISAQGLRSWVKQAKIDVGRGQPGELTTDERAEVRRFRRENHVLRQEREILKKAAAFFAKETT
jgi:transposase